MEHSRQGRREKREGGRETTEEKRGKGRRERGQEEKEKYRGYREGDEVQYTTSAVVCVCVCAVAHNFSILHGAHNYSTIQMTGTRIN